MAFIPVPNTLMAEMIYWNGNSYSENTLYFKAELPVQDSDPENIWMFLEAWWKENCQSLVSSNIALNKIKVTDISEEDGFFFEAAVTGGTGGNIGAILPMNVTAAVKFNTGRSGRSYRGRNYWIGLVEGQVTADVVEAVTRVAIIAAYTDLLDHAGAEGFQWVVVSRYQNGAPLATGIATPIVSVTMNSEVDSQRRRLFGRGS